MKYKLTLLLLILVSLSSAQSTKLNPIPFNEVQLEDEFWLPRLKTQKDVLVPFALQKTERAVENLYKTALFLKGDTTDLPFAHRFISSDLYKVMEGAAYLLQMERDPELEKQLDNIIDIIAAAQQEDGYLYVAHITGVSRDASHWGGGGMGDRPYSHVIHSHELYNMGHMYEAAIAYYQATGKRKWLDIAEKNAQHINKVFFEGDPNYNDGKPVNQAPGHQELELALVKLYRVTNNPLYLEMSRKFLDIRGISFIPDGKGVNAPSYAQQHKPVTQQTNAVGHAVRAAYLYTGMADVDAASGTHDYKAALNAIWHNIVDTKMHITGGSGAVHGIEGFGPEYELPNKNAYNETCAAVGNVFFNYRMFLAEKDARFLDVAEVSLYNNALAGVNLDGNKFFYVNPLETDGKAFNHGKTGRSPWFGTACCPSNIARLIPQVSGMMYATEDNTIYCTFYGGNSTKVSLSSGHVAIKQETDYPFHGNIRLAITPEKSEQEFAVKLRIPTWATKQFVPGSLYSYTHPELPEVKILLNGTPIDYRTEKGFALINRTWNNNDHLELQLPMPVQLNRSMNEVKVNQNRLAVTSGPLVFCAEETDNNGLVQRLMLNDNMQIMAKTKSITMGQLNSLKQINIQGKELKDEQLQDATIVYTPYFAWNNRGDGSMIVWTPTKSELLKESASEARGGKFKKVSASHTFASDDVAAISAGDKPESSSDTSIKRWTSWPQKSKKQWLEIELKEMTTLQSIGVYWYHDDRGVKVPEEWSLEYLHNDHWHEFPLYVTDSYSNFRDQYNVVHPGEEITSNKIRISVQPQPGYTVGILDVEVEAVETGMLKSEDIRIRDPYIYADPITKQYYMYAQMDNRLGGRGDDAKPKGVEAYVSTDLKNWEQPKTVLLLPEEFWARNMVWAPEMHAYKGKYYMFVTLTSSDVHTHIQKPKGAKNWPAFHKRGTQVFVSDSPLGPFEAFDNKPHTPENWMALDGTLFEENGNPYMIFCHEWVEIVDGSMDYIRLSEDLSKPIGKPKLMFHASEASWSTGKTNKVTDGCFMHRSKTGKLLMIWSSFGTKGYAIGIAESKSGKLKGPWIQQEELLFKENGGHGMLFKTFDGKLMLALHQPNSPRGRERLKLFELVDTGESLRLKKSQ